MDKIIPYILFTLILVLGACTQAPYVYKPIPLERIVPAPVGAKALCETYDWACSSRPGPLPYNHASLMTAINRTVNSQIQDRTDQQLYGQEEFWTLPTTAGDCEDFALLKKKRLLEAGFPGDTLLIATVLSKGDGHAVLVVRTPEGDMVLDNLRSQITPWDRTPYTFMRIQNPANPAQWRLALNP